MTTTIVTDQKFDPTYAKNLPKRQIHAPLSRYVNDERLFMKVDHYEHHGQDDGGGDWAVGHAFFNPEQKLKVRLSTFEERMSDLPLANEDRLLKSYTGENRRESLPEKARSKIGLLAFDGSREIGVDTDGTKLYRSHWPQTMAVKPEAEVTAGLGSIVLYQPKEGSTSKPDAYIEFLRTATLVNRTNVRQAMMSALSIKDDNGHSQETHALMRVFYLGEEVATARIFPSREQTIVKDPLYGNEKTVLQAQDAETSFKELRESKVTGIHSMDANNDLARSIIAGLMGDENPPLANTLELDQAVNFFNGAKGGEFIVEIVNVERMKFGMDTAKTYLKDRENKKLSGYIIKTEVDGQEPTIERGYGDTVVAFQRYPNGQPYAVYASPETNYPKVRSLSQFDAEMPLSKFIPQDPKALSVENTNNNDLKI